MADKPQPASGKGDKPRNCFSSKFKNNYDEIDWGKSKTPKLNTKEPNKKNPYEAHHQV
jgi:hypothetical protein